MPRPSVFTEHLADEICERLADGQSLREICDDDHMPNRRTVFRWLAADPPLGTFCHQYARAREAQADALADDIVAIADQTQEGTRMEECETADGSFSKTVTEDMLGHRRLQIDARKWAASKLAPKKYGDRIEHDGTVTIRHEDALAALK